ncbi:hypothetical protein ACJMK2_044609 [Sinanodonta woodiana]|uniref:Uncharacterized protein n=1 Tax=Sinanodonta woodiana TaxID=1069815 RepID=A0ABD3W0K8_SINWO
MLAAIDQQEEFKEDLLGALDKLRKAWGLVKPVTLHNCFMHAFFPENEEFHGFSPSAIPHLEEDDGLYECIGIPMDGFVRMAIETDKEQ